MLAIKLFRFRTESPKASWRRCASSLHNTDTHTHRKIEMHMTKEQQYKVHFLVLRRPSNIAFLVLHTSHNHLLKSPWYSCKTYSFLTSLIYAPHHNSIALHSPVNSPGIIQETQNAIMHVLWHSKRVRYEWLWQPFITWSMDCICSAILSRDSRLVSMRLLTAGIYTTTGEVEY